MLEAPNATLGTAETVVAGILKAIDYRQFAPGQRLVEGDLAASFGVSRNSVREALQRLAADGIVELLRYKGAVIRLLTVQDTLDVLDVAQRITGLLARTSARAVREGADGRPLRDAINELRSAHASRDVIAFAGARRSYYRAQLALADSRELRRLFPAIQMPIVYAQFPLSNLSSIRLQDYPVVAREVLAGNEDGADMTAMAHVQSVRAAILEVARRPHILKSASRNR